MSSAPPAPPERRAVRPGVLLGSTASGSRSDGMCVWTSASKSLLTEDRGDMASRFAQADRGGPRRWWGRRRQCVLARRRGHSFCSLRESVAHRGAGVVRRACVGIRMAPCSPWERGSTRPRGAPRTAHTQAQKDALLLGQRRYAFSVWFDGHGAADAPQP